MAAIILYVLGVVHIGLIFFTVHNFVIPCPKRQQRSIIACVVLWPVSWLFGAYQLYQHRGRIGQAKRGPFADTLFNSIHRR